MDGILMNTNPITLLSAPRILVKYVDEEAEHLRTIKRLDFSAPLTCDDSSALSAALAFYRARGGNAAIIATEMSLAGLSNAELARLQGLLFNAIVTGVAVSLTPFQAEVCIFDHDPSIDTSLAAIGITRSMPDRRGASMYRGLCHQCSRIMSGTCITPPCPTLFAPFVAKTGSSFLPSITPTFGTTNATEHGERLLDFFKDALTRPAGKAIPMSLVFIYQVITYFDYMNGVTTESTLTTFASTNSPRDIFTARIINNMTTLLKASQMPTSLDPTFLAPENVRRGALTTIRHTPTIDSLGNVLVDIDQSKLILAGKTTYGESGRKLLADVCNRII